MMRKLGSLAIALAIVPSLVACGEDAPDSSVSGVFPSSAFLGRQARIEISGDVTTWDAPTVSFGEGVTVDAVNVASPTALFVDVTIAPTAAAGLRTVTVTDGGEMLELKDAFELEAPLDIKVKGTLAQGSVVALTINNRDFETPFDTSFTGDGFFEPLVFVGVSLTAPDGSQVFVDDVQPYSIAATALVDIDAVPGPFSVVSGVAVEEQITSPGGVFDVAPRTATAITGATMGMATAPLSTELYEFTATGSPSLLQVSITAQNPSAAPGVIVLGPSGSFDEIIAYSDDVDAPVGGGKVYLIPWDNTGAAGYSFTVTPASAAMTTATEAAANDSAATAQVAGAMPFALQNATLSSSTDQDWVRVTVTQADVGKRLRVKTYGADPETDTVVQFFQGAAGTQAFGNESSDQGFHEDHRSPVISTSGTYYVKIVASSYFSSAHKDYDAAIFID